MNKHKKEPIKFEKERDFGELIGAPFIFLFQEFRNFSLTLLRYAGPYIAVAILGMIMFSNKIYIAIDTNTEPSLSIILFALIFSLFNLIAYISAIVVTHSYISLYVKQGKDNFTSEEVGNLFRKKFFPVFGAGFLVFLIVFAGSLLFWIPGIYFSYALIFFSISIIYENISAGESISRSFQIIKGEWWITFALLFVFGLIISFVGSFFIIPVYIGVFITALTGSSFSGGLIIFIIILMSVMFIVNLFIVALQQMIIAFQYFSILIKKEELFLEDRIDAINTDEEKTADVFKKVETNNEDGEEKNENHDNRFSQDDDPNRFKPKF